MKQSEDTSRLVVQVGSLQQQLSQQQREVHENQQHVLLDRAQQGGEKRQDRKLPIRRINGQQQQGQQWQQQQEQSLQLQYHHEQQPQQQQQQNLATTDMKTEDQWTEVRKRSKKEQKTVKPKPRPDIIIVKANDMSYSDMLKRLKAGKEVQALSKSINAVTPTKEGHLRLVLDRKTTDTKNLTEAISSAIGYDATCTRLTDMVKIEIRDVDEEANDEEITEAITTATDPQKNPKIISKRKTGRGTQVVTAMVPAAAANVLVPRLRIGYVICRVRRQTEVKKCFRCQNYGHTRSNCDAPDQSNACWKCGGQGHKSRECSEEPKCLLCKDEASDDHIMGSFRCHAFRRALDAAKQPAGVNRSKNDKIPANQPQQV